MGRAPGVIRKAIITRANSVVAFATVWVFIPTLTGRATWVNGAKEIEPDSG